MCLHSFREASKHFKEQFLQRLDVWWPSTSNHSQCHGHLPFVISSEDGRLQKGQVLFGSHGLYNLTLMVRVIYGVNNTLLTLKGIITVYTQTQRSYRRNQGSSQLAYSSLLVLPADSSLCVPGDLPYSQRSMPNQTPAQDPSASIFLYGKPQLMTNGEVYPP